MAEKESLAAKIDEDVNIYVNKMIEKNRNYRYAHPLSEDNWEEVGVREMVNRIRPHNH